MIARRRGGRSRSAALSGAAVVVLVALAAAGAWARRSLSYRALPGGRTLIDLLRQATGLLAIAALAAGIVVFVSVIQRRRAAAFGRRPTRRRTRQEWLATAIAALLAVAAVAVARVAASSRSGRAVAKSAQPSASRGSGGHSPWHLGVAPGAIIAAVVLVTVLGAVLLIRFRGRPAPAADRTTAVMAQAAAGGRRALSAATEPRAAILGAYLAMEEQLAEGGFVLSPARTASEVLHGAADGGQVDPHAAAVLVGLFERARFSSQPVTAADRVRALAALDVLASGLTP